MAHFSFEFKVEPREARGKGASRRLRHQDHVPGIVYGRKEEPEAISLAHRDILKALESDGIYSHIITLNKAGTKQKVVLKDIQRHPFKPRVLHLDFLRIDENKPITMHIPVHFLGEKTAPGVILEGGIVTHHMVELEIKCLPKDIPECINIDLSDAKLDTIVHLSQIALPANVELVASIHGPEDDLPVVSIHKPKRIIEEVSESADAPVEADAEDTTEGSSNKKE